MKEPNNPDSTEQGECRPSDEGQASWSLADHIDLELMVRADSSEEGACQDDLHKRDRKIYLQIAKGEAGTPPSPDCLASWSFLFRRWLGKRRSQLHRDHDSPGEEIFSWFQFWWFVLFALGVVFAVGLVQAFFGVGRFVEKAPVNVVWLFWCCIAPAFLLTLAGFVFALRGMKAGGKLRYPVFARSLYRHVLQSRLERKMEKLFASTVDREASLDMAAVRGTIQAVIKSKLAILSTAVFLWFQSFALGYAVALPVIVFVQIKFVSHDFAWQSTTGTTPEGFHRRISSVAAPWAWWMGEGSGYPTLEQVRQTRYIKRDPLEQQPVEAWEAWAWFTVLASLFYVAIPRLLLFLFSYWRLRKLLSKECFREARFDSLRERMTTPHVSWDKEKKEDDPPEEPPGPSKPPPVSSPREPVPTAPPGPSHDVCLLALTRDFEETVPEAAKAALKTKHGWVVNETLFYQATKSGYQALIDEAKARLGNAGHGRIVLVEDAATPPIREWTSFLRELRSGLGAKTSLVVGLLGEAPDDPLGDPADSEEVRVWKRTIQSLGDPNLCVVTLWT